MLSSLLLTISTGCARSDRLPAPDMDLRAELYDVTSRVMLLEGQVTVVQEGLYLQDVAAHVQDTWNTLLSSLGRQPRLPKPEYAMLAVVTVDAGGHVLDTAIKYPSESEKLDALLLQAITESSPLPAPPAEQLGGNDTLSFDLRWEVVNHRPVQ